MHLSRRISPINLPIERKGTKYIARAMSHHTTSVPVVIAIRDMLNLARTAKEVRKMIQQKILKINGRVVSDYRETIQLFNILEADKTYELSIMETKKFFLKPIKSSGQRLCKVTDKRLIKNNILQLNLHDGTNIQTKDKINVGDSVYLDFANKIKKHVKLEKGSEVFIISGKYTGQEGKIESLDGNLSMVKLKGGTANLNKNAVIAI